MFCTCPAEPKARWGSPTTIPLQPRAGLASCAMRRAAAGRRGQGTERETSVSWVTETISARPTTRALARESCQRRLSSGFCWSSVDVRA